MTEYIVEVIGQMSDAIYERELTEVVRCRDCQSCVKTTPHKVNRKSAPVFDFCDKNVGRMTWKEIHKALKEKGYRYVDSESLRTTYQHFKRTRTRLYCCKLGHETEPDGFCAWGEARKHGGTTGAASGSELVR